jgi:hypothetical protein
MGLPEVTGERSSASSADDKMDVKRWPAVRCGGDVA